PAWGRAWRAVRMAGAAQPQVGQGAAHIQGRSKRRPYGGHNIRLADRRFAQHRLFAPDGPGGVRHPCFWPWPRFANTVVGGANGARACIWGYATMAAPFRAVAGPGYGRNAARAAWPSVIAKRYVPCGRR